MDIDPLIASYIGRLWEWGALVGVLVSACVIEALVIRALYHRNTALADAMMTVMLDTKEVLTEIRDSLKNYGGGNAKDH